MSTPFKVVQGFDYACIGGSGAVFVVCIIGAIYACPCRRTSRKDEVATEFNGLWKARVFLQLVGALWALAQILRLDALWVPEGVIFRSKPDVTGWTRNGVLCRIYLTLSLGILQPLFLCTALLLCRSSLRRQKAEANWTNTKVLGCAMLLTIPVGLCQAAVAWASSFFPNNNAWQKQTNTVLHYLFAPFTLADTNVCGPRYGNCAVCIFPAVGDIISVLFSVLYLFLFWRTTRRMSAAIINKHMHLRLRVFQFSAMSGIVIGEICRTVTLVSSPYHWPFEILWIVYWLSILVIIMSFTGLLVLLPNWDTIRARQAHHKHSRSDDQEMRSMDAGNGKLGFENPGKMNGIKV